MREAMNKSRNEAGMQDGQLMIAKQILIQGADRQSGGCAWQVACLLSGGLCRVPESGMRGSRGLLTLIGLRMAAFK